MKILDNEIAPATLRENYDFHYHQVEERFTSVRLMFFFPFLNVVQTPMKSMLPHSTRAVDCTRPIYVKVLLRV